MQISKSVGVKNKVKCFFMLISWVMIWEVTIWTWIWHLILWNIWMN